MKPFEHFSVPRILFGRGQFAHLGELAKPLGKKALLVCNGPEAPILALVRQLSAAGINGATFRQTGEPTVEVVDATLALAREEACDFVIGIGGGSAIDTAKAVAGLLTNGDSVLDFMEVVGKGQKITKPAAPWIAIPCTAGTGAEVTRNAVIGFRGTEKTEPFKASLRSEHLLPRVALIDPELALTISPEVTARTGMDALCQCIEAYTSTHAQPFTDSLALEGITRAARSLPRAFANSADLDAREDLSLAALQSGIALTNAGLGGVHGFAAPSGAAFPIPHGLICAALLPRVVEANIAALQAAGKPGEPGLQRYATVARALVGPDHKPSLSDEDARAEGLKILWKLLSDLQIGRFGKFGLTPEHINDICLRAQKASSMRYNPVALPLSTLEQILFAAL